MLKEVDLDVRLNKHEYKRRSSPLEDRLILLQRSCWENKIPSMVVFEGWDAAGKGTAISMLASHLDPRGIRIHAILPPSILDKEMPWLWRFWLLTPAYGEMAIFDRSWYRKVLDDVLEKPSVKELDEAYRNILSFEEELARDGTVIQKFFLHINKKEQQRRFEKIESDPLQSWRVTKKDWEQHEHYKEYAKAYDEMLERTNTEWGVWSVVEATDLRWTRVKILETLCQKLEDALHAKGVQLEGMPEEIVVPTDGKG